MGYAVFKRKNRVIRLAAGLLLPGFLGAILFFAAVAISTVSSDDNIVEIFSGFFSIQMLGIILLSYLFVGLPSAIYSLLMEFVINPHTINNAFVIILSMLLGMLSGVVVFGIFGFVSLIVGAVVGLIVGIMLRWLYIKAPISN